MDWQHELKVAIEATRAAGKIINDGFTKIHTVAGKADKTLVSEIDRGAEDAILKILKDDFPSHSFLAEESGGSGESEYLWVIDPLDGTTNYLSDIPIFASTVCLVYRQKPVVAVIMHPLFNQVFTAIVGKGSFLNGAKINVSKVSEIPASIVCFTRGVTPEIKQKLTEIFTTFEPKARTTRILGSAVMQFAYLAAGKVDGLVNVETKIWDVVAGVLIVQEAGGEVTDFKGEPWDITKTNIVASNSNIHKQLLDYL